MQRFRQFLIAVDQVFNTLVGSGWCDETLSAWAWRTQDENPNLWQVLDVVFFFDPQHCYNSYLSEQKRNHLPPEYR